MERDPWFSEKNCTGPFPVWKGGAGGETSPPPLGCKADGGGCHRAQGKVGGMVLHRAACNRDMKGDLVSLFNPLEEETRERSGKRERERERELGTRKRCLFRSTNKKKKGGKLPRVKKTRPFSPRSPPCFLPPLPLKTPSTALRVALASGANPNEVEAAGNTPLAIPPVTRRVAFF